MIIDRLKNASMYFGLNPRIAAALRFLQKTDLARLEPGRHEIDGDTVYVMVIHNYTKLAEGASWEAHRRYIDVQYVFEGAERMGYANLDGLKVREAYDEKKECVLLDGEGDFLVVPAGTFVIFAPQDAHMPCIALKSPQPVKKAVVKVLAE
jgi:YhcH/YjgK/YiaL family protein